MKLYIEISHKCTPTIITSNNFLLKIRNIAALCIYETVSVVYRRTLTVLVIVETTHISRSLDFEIRTINLIL